MDGKKKNDFEWLRQIDAYTLPEYLLCDPIDGSRLTMQTAVVIPLRSAFDGLQLWARSMRMQTSVAKAFLGRPFLSSDNDATVELFPAWQSSITDGGWAHPLSAQFLDPFCETLRTLRSHVALVGPAGTGKTTICSVMTRELRTFAENADLPLVTGHLSQTNVAAKVQYDNFVTLNPGYAGDCVLIVSPPVEDRVDTRDDPWKGTVVRRLSLGPSQHTAWNSLLDVSKYLHLFVTVGKLNRREVPFSTPVDLLEGVATVVFIDEAAQLLDVSAEHVPNFLQKRGLAVASGDPRQLPAFCRREKSAISVLKHLINSSPSMLLSVQHRMRSGLGDMVSVLSYEQLITNAPSCSTTDTRLSFAVFTWTGVNDSTGEAFPAPREADYVILLAFLLRELYPNKSLLIVSFYKGQVTRLRAKLCRSNIDIKTVDGAQGIEADIVCLSELYQAYCCWNPDPSTFCRTTIYASMLALFCRMFQITFYFLDSMSVNSTECCVLAFSVTWRPRCGF